MLPSDPPTTASDAEALELAMLEGLVRGVTLPAPTLPGWQSLTAHEYEQSVQELAALLGTVAAALAAGRAAR